MDRDHRGRVALRGLHGPKREAAKLALLMRPSAARKYGKQRRGLYGLGKMNPKGITLSLRVTPEQYLALRDTAKVVRTSMSELVRIRLRSGSWRRYV